MALILIKQILMTALQCACSTGHIGIVKCLLDNNADTNLQTNYGWTALHYACAEANVEVVKLLLSYYANETIQTTSEFKTGGESFFVNHLSPLDMAKLKLRKNSPNEYDIIIDILSDEDKIKEIRGQNIWIHRRLIEYIAINKIPTEYFVSLMRK